MISDISYMIYVYVKETDTCLKKNRCSGCEVSERDFGIKAMLQLAKLAKKSSTLL